MKRILKPILLLISTFALFIASTSSAACVVWSLREPAMPKSLIRED